MSQKEHFFFVFDVSNGDTRFLLLLLLIERVSNVISENMDFFDVFRFDCIKKKRKLNRAVLNHEQINSTL